MRYNYISVQPRWNCSRIELHTRCFGGDPPAQSTGESTKEMLQSFINAFPELIDVVIPGMTKSAQGNLAASQATAPGFANLQTELLRGPGSELAAAGDEINAASAMRQAQSDADVVAGPGRNLVQQALETSRLYDAPFFDTRDVMAQKYQDLLKGQDPNKLTGAEAENLNRGLAQEAGRRGTSTSPSAIETLGAANTFGSALQNKRSVLNQTLQTANQFLQPSKSGVDTFQVATGKSSQSNPGVNAFQGVNQDAGNNANSIAGGLLNQIGGIKQQETAVNANRRDSMDRAIDVYDDY